MSADLSISSLLASLGLGHRRLTASRYDAHEVFDLETGERFALMDAHDAAEFLASQGL